MKNPFHSVCCGNERATVTERRNSIAPSPCGHPLPGERAWSFYICPPFLRGTPRFLRQGVFVSSYHTPCGPPCQGGQNPLLGERAWCEGASGTTRFWLHRSV